MMTVATWVIQCVAIAALLGLAAHAWEAAARWSGHGLRWPWLVALSGSVLLPFVLRLVPERAQLPGPVDVLLMDPLFMATPVVASSSPWWDARMAALVLWLALTLSMFVYVVAVMLRLRRARSGWRAADVDGNRVWVTRGLGPAAVGVRQGMIVVPAWALELEPDLRALLLQHEREHVRARDPRLLFTGVLLVASMPWNPLLWMMLVRLRNAIEMDCDARVLSSGASPQRYGRLLLEVGRRRSSGVLVMATFAEPRLFLEDRIRRIAAWPVRRRPGRAAAFGVLALVLCATAVSARVRVQQNAAAEQPAVLQALGLPNVQMDVAMIPIMAVDTPPRAPAVQSRPTFTPMTVRPELINRETVQRALREQYPATLRDAGIGGAAVVWFFIDEQGVPVKTQLSRSSGYPALDEAALHVAQLMRFTPPLNRGKKVQVWVQIPITFTAASDPAESLEQRAQLEMLAAHNAARAAAVSPSQSVTRVRPELLNAAEVQRAMVRAYPPLLRDAGIGGVATVWLYIEESGIVTKTQIAQSSGRAELDDAALSVAPLMRFSPLLDDGVRTAAWVELPIAFGNAEVPPPTSTAADVYPLGALRASGERAPAADAPVNGVRPAPVPLQRRGNADLADAPVFTPMTQRPELLNTREVQRALVQNYPPMLRDAGIGGTAVVWFFIDEAGNVAKTQLSRTSGYPALDQAALTIAQQMKFTPALNRDRPVQVWLEIPIVFTAK